MLLPSPTMAADSVQEVHLSLYGQLDELRQLHLKVVPTEEPNLLLEYLYLYQIKTFMN